MLMLQSPSLAINSHDVPWPPYRMWETVNAPPGMNTEGCVREIIRVNRLALEHERKPLQNVVINCHGADDGGALYIGGEDEQYWPSRINDDRVHPFAWLKSRNIGTIWLVACKAAYGHFGKKLCQAIATLSGCQVVAADEDQDVGIWGTFRIVQGGGRGQIDEFEGKVYLFPPAGVMREIDPHEAIYTILE
jgi:hypothetical protein